MPKKKGGGGGEKGKKKLFLNERETVNYEQQILDYNRQLARLRTRNEQLETDSEELKKKLNQLEEDRADVVAHLKKILEEKTKEAFVLGERLVALQDMRKEEQAAYKKKEQSMEADFRAMETSLTAEIKLVAGKLNALEDWRLARIDLMRKFEIQEEQMIEQEERHKRTLYEAEKSLIIGKAKMKREMEERLEDLAQSFRDATNIRIADATHRAVRENIALNKELDAMLKVCRELEIRTKEYEERDRILRTQASLFQAEAKMALNKSLKQTRIIDRLTAQHLDAVIDAAKLHHAENMSKTKEDLMQRYKEQCMDAQKNIRILEQHVQRAKAARDEIRAELRANCAEVARIKRILHAAKTCIEQALQLQNETLEEDVCVSCYPEVKEQLLHTLMDILAQRDASEILESERSFRGESTRCAYSRGDLGMVPSSEFRKRGKMSDRNAEIKDTRGEKSLMSTDNADNPFETSPSPALAQFTDTE
ncbi:cilia- and flagella-associated protein 157 [Orussus abietinus]|uniref:cilia- and flagella-associated protein 157 n=1 Tax=Orussus abietinus TaxID=222816 RepID=UPI000626BB3E|nr:cilia- and flagella-associated protein 157 [Orussus abietinus]